MTNDSVRWEAEPKGARKIVMELVKELDPSLLASPAIEKAVADIEAAQRSARQQVIDRTKLLASFQRDYCALHEKHAPRCANCIRARAMLANSEDLVYQLESWDYGAQLTDTTGAGGA